MNVRTFFKDSAEYFKRLKNNIIMHRIDNRAIISAFFQTMAFFPFATSLITAAVKLGLVTGEAIESLTLLMPESAHSILRIVFYRANSPNATSILSWDALLGLYLSSRGVNSLRSGLNNIFSKSYKGSFIKLRISNLIYTILTILIGAIALSSIALSITIYKNLSTAIPLMVSGYYLPVYLKETVFILSSIIPFLLLVFLFIIIYSRLPAGKLSFVYVFPGAFFSALLWVLLSFLFALWADFFILPAVYLGSLNGVVAIMLWMFSTNLVLLFGGELINARKIKKSALADF